jgi:hypothetical protein
LISVVKYICRGRPSVTRAISSATSWPSRSGSGTSACVFTSISSRSKLPAPGLLTTTMS